MPDFKHTPEEVQERLREAQERLREAQERFKETNDRLIEARSHAIDLARQRAAEAQELTRKASEAMPPGLLVRLLSTLAGIPLIFVLVFWDKPYGALPFTGGIALCGVIGAGEFFRSVRAYGYQPSEWVAYLAIASLQFAAWNGSRQGLEPFLPALMALLVIATMVHQVLRHNPEPVKNIGVTFLGVVYLGWLISYMVALRSFAGEVQPLHFIPALKSIIPALYNLPHSPLGAWAVLYVFFVTWMADAGAYFVGSHFARRGKGIPLAPRLSPKKTRQGFYGGLLFGLLSSLFWGLPIGIPLIHCLVLGPLLGALGQVGDLCESALKRDLGVKDFGGILPGHGGILDRFDSILFTAPIAYYYLRFLVGGM
jgi:phosphatidate cytidylyltransferase